MIIIIIIIIISGFMSCHSFKTFNSERERVDIVYLGLYYIKITNQATNQPIDHHHHHHHYHSCSRRIRIYRRLRYFFLLSHKNLAVKGMKKKKKRTKKSSTHFWTRRKIFRFLIMTMKMMKAARKMKWSF